MNHKDYTKEAERTSPNLGSDFFDQLHMAIGLATEAGEILDTFKKTFAYGKELDVVNIKEELGDSFWYMFNLMRMLGLDFEEILSLNSDKLRARFKNGYSKQEALNRDLENERKILEGNSNVKLISQEEVEKLLEDGN